MCYRHLLPHFWIITFQTLYTKDLQVFRHYWRTLWRGCTSSVGIKEKKMKAISLTWEYLTLCAAHTTHSVSTCIAHARTSHHIVRNHLHRSIYSYWLQLYQRRDYLLIPLPLICKKIQTIPFILSSVIDAFNEQFILKSRNDTILFLN